MLLVSNASPFYGTKQGVNFQKSVLPFGTEGPHKTFCTLHTRATTSFLSGTRTSSRNQLVAYDHLAFNSVHFVSQQSRNSACTAINFTKGFGFLESILGAVSSKTTLLCRNPYTSRNLSLKDLLLAGKNDGKLCLITLFIYCACEQIQHNYNRHIYAHICHLHMHNFL